MDPRTFSRELSSLLQREPLFSPVVEHVVEVERTLGEGGMGVVHLVRDRRLGRRAALKLMKGAADPDAVRRFLREAQITARLDHPGIPPVYEAGRSSTGEHFLLMRFVDGRSLASIVRAKDRPPLKELVATLAKVSDAAAYAHSRRVIHRDLKPANVMGGAFGEVLVMDWGVARDLGESRDDDRAFRTSAAPSEVEGQTEKGTIVGTLGYMPPEQANGDDLDARADVFALGAILVEVLTGKPPIEGASFANKLAATLQGKVVLPRMRDARAPRELDAIAARALAVRREDRYPDATSFAADLRAWVEGRDVSVHRYGPLERTARLARRHPGFFIAAGSTVALSSGAAVIVGVQNVAIRRANEALVAEEKARADAELGRAAATKEKADHIEASALLDRAGKRLLSGASLAEVKELVRVAIARRRTEANLVFAAELLLRAGDRAEARALFRACADEFPPGYRALYGIHKLEARRGDWTSPAMVELTARARERGDENEYVLIHDGMKLASAGDLDGAIALHDRAIARQPKLAMAYAGRAGFKLNKNDADGALADVEKAIELEPGEPETLSVRGLALAHRKDFDRALRDFDHAIAIDPGRPHFHVYRAKVLYDLKDFQAAADGVDRALALDQGYAAAYELRSYLRLRKGDHPGAIEDLKTVLSLRPDGSHADSVRRRLAKLEAGTGAPR